MESCKGDDKVSSMNLYSFGVIVGGEVVLGFGEVINSGFEGF